LASASSQSRGHFHRASSISQRIISGRARDFGQLSMALRWITPVLPFECLRNRENCQHSSSIVKNSVRYKWVKLPPSIHVILTSRTSRAVTSPSAFHRSQEKRPQIALPCKNVFACLIWKTFSGERNASPKILNLLARRPRCFSLHLEVFFHLGCHRSRPNRFRSIVLTLFSKDCSHRRLLDGSPSRRRS